MRHSYFLQNILTILVQHILPHSSDRLLCQMDCAVYNVCPCRLMFLCGEYLHCTRSPPFAQNPSCRPVAVDAPPSYDSAQRCTKEKGAKMPFTITTTGTCYLLPQDGATVKADFLKHLLDPGETWIIAYAFTLTDMSVRACRLSAVAAP